ncbi:ribosome hibernation-promoting factor, HPF/YfiA family [Megalodesulfovibrio paquesii]
MQITFTFKNFEPSEHLKQYAQRRFEKLTKFLERTDASAELQVAMSVEKQRHMAEVKLVGDGLHLSASESSEDMYQTVDLVLDKLDAQMRKHREKGKDKRKGGDVALDGRTVRTEVFQLTPTPSGGRERSIVDSDHFQPKPMNVEEAAEQLETSQEQFLVFLDAETSRVNVLYRRKNGDYGLIDPGM